MSGEGWRVDSLLKLKAFHAHTERLFEQHGDTTYRWSHGPPSSLDQKALFHVWCREWVAHKIRIRPDDVSPAQLASMKRTVKKIFYENTAYPWMVQQLQDLSVPDGKTFTAYTSCRDWLVGEMFLVLTFMQDVAAQDGLVLEAKGQFAKLQRKQREV